MSNILQAIKRVVANPKLDVEEHGLQNNRINSVGKNLEEYIKNLFADTFESDTEERKTIFDKIFSYQGGAKNPPDLMIRDGDAIEIKKIESEKGELALNSSHPKSKLYVKDTKINNSCRNCEDWTVKDFIYAVGQIPKGEEKLRYLWMVYGDCFCSEKETYENVLSNIKSEIKNNRDIDFSETNELARVKNVDPLGFTNLRVRGMFNLTNPKKIFSELDSSTEATKFQLMSIMKKDKYESFPEIDRKSLEKLSDTVDGFLIKEVKIKNPNHIFTRSGWKRTIVFFWELLHQNQTTESEEYLDAVVLEFIINT